MIDTRPTRNLALELVRVTEAAALGAGRFMGRGDKIAADRAAVNGMRLVLNSIQMDGVIVIGEGEKDEAPMLYNGEKLGTGDPPLVDIAVDPIDGTRPLAAYVGGPEALARRLMAVGVVADLETALALWPQLSVGQRLVTPAGDLVRWDGFRAAGPNLVPSPGAATGPPPGAR